MDILDELRDPTDKQKAELLIGLQSRLRRLISKEREKLTIISKGKGDYTTNVDLAVEEFLAKQSFLVDDDLLSEEKVKKYSGAPRCWLIDPIDGTVKGLIKGKVKFSVLVTLTKSYRPVFSWIYLPIENVWYLAVFKKVVLQAKGKQQQILTRTRTAHSGVLVNKNGVFHEIRDNVGRRSTHRNFIDIYLDIISGRFNVFLVDYSNKRVMWAHDYFPLWTLLSTTGLKIFADDLQTAVKFDLNGRIVNPKGMPVTRLIFAKTKREAQAAMRFF